MSEAAAAIMIAHMLGGQTLIGQVVVDNVARTKRMDRPYEVLVMPSPESQAATVAVIKFGSILGLMPEIALEAVPLNAANLLGLSEPSQKLLASYMKALEREMNPVTKAEVDARIKPSNDDAAA